MRMTGQRMISFKKWLLPGRKATAITLIVALALLGMNLYGTSIKHDKLTFPLNTSCRGNMIVEATYDNQRARLTSSLYFSFLDNHKILISLSGTGFLYDNSGKIIERKTLLRNIYYDSARESKFNDTYALTSTQINIDSVDNMDWEMSSLLLMNTFFLNGRTDTLVLKKYDDTTMLIESNQSPLTMCVFKNGR